ncbi:hypothetical protein AX15_002455 [Amanita polypyramis BW_CC]|nr:hypothetical protein AX15_002455 [Amanita polypyramis BW_CC]
MTFLRRIWQSFRNPRVYAGQDMEGNKFYEYPASSSDPRRTKRMVQYRHPDDMWEYIGGGRRLSVQWTSWLTHTRFHPPTLEELQVDLERQQRVKADAALIEARDNENRVRSIAEGAAAVEEAQRTRIEQVTNDEQSERLSPERTTSTSPLQYDKAPSHENQPETKQQEGQEEVCLQQDHEVVRKTETDSEGHGVVGKLTESPWVKHTEETLKPQEWAPQMRSRGE